MHTNKVTQVRARGEYYTHCQPDREAEGRRDPGPWGGACGKGDTAGEEAPAAPGAAQ